MKRDKQVAIYSHDMQAFSREDNWLMDIAGLTLDGELDPLKTVAYFRHVKEVADKAEKLVKGMAEDALHKYSDAELKKGVLIGDFEMAIRTTGSGWVHTDGTILAAKRRLKQLEELGRDAAAGKVAVDPETGAIITASTKKPGQQNMVLTLRKKS